MGLGMSAEGPWLLRWRAAWAIVRAELKVQKALRRYDANPSDITREPWLQAWDAAACVRRSAWDSVGRGPTGERKVEEAMLEASLSARGCEEEVAQRLGAWRAGLRAQGLLTGAVRSYGGQADSYSSDPRDGEEGGEEDDDEPSNGDEPGNDDREDSDDGEPSGDDEEDSEHEEPGGGDGELAEGLASGAGSAEAELYEAGFGEGLSPDALRIACGAAARTSGRAPPQGRGRTTRRGRPSRRARRRRRCKVLLRRSRAFGLRLRRRRLRRPLRQQRRGRGLRQSPGRLGLTRLTAASCLTTGARQKRGPQEEDGRAAEEPTRVPVADFGVQRNLLARPREPD